MKNHLFTVIMRNDLTKEEEELEIVAKNAREASEMACMRLSWEWVVKSIILRN